MPVYYGGDTDHNVRATQMPRNKPALFRTPVRPGCFFFSNNRGHFLVIAGSKRFNAVLVGVATVCPGVPRCPHRSHAGAENRDSVNRNLRCGQISWTATAHDTLRSTNRSAHLCLLCCFCVYIAINLFSKTCYTMHNMVCDNISRRLLKSKWWKLSKERLILVGVYNDDQLSQVLYSKEQVTWYLYKICIQLELLSLRFIRFAKR